MATQEHNHKFMLERVIERVQMATRRLESEFAYLKKGSPEYAVGLIFMNSLKGVADEVIKDYPKSFQSSASEVRKIGLIESLDRIHESLNWAIVYLENRRIESMNSQYPRNSLGHVLQALRDYGIVETIAGSVTVGDGMIMYGSKPFASYKYFDGIEQPLFRFQDQVYMQQKFVQLDNGKIKPQFRLTLSVHGTPAFEINGVNATPQLHDLIRSKMLTNYMPEKGYQLSKDSGAFFQGGSDNREGKWIYIEFWQFRGAQAWLDYLNELYEPPMQEQIQFEQREYDAAWFRNEIEYVVNGDVYVANTQTSDVNGFAESRLQGKVVVEEDVVIRFEAGGAWLFNPPLLPHKK